MQLKASARLEQRPVADCLILPCWQGKSNAELAVNGKAFVSALEMLWSTSDFLGKEGEIVCIYPAKGKEKRIVLIGLGEKKKISPELLRRSYASAAKMALKKKWMRVNAAVPDEEPSMAVAALEGIFIANYRVDQWKSTPEGKGAALITHVCLAGVEKKDFEKCQHLLEVFQGVNLVRDLVNGNADDVNPDTLAKAAKDVHKEFSQVKVTVLDKAQITKEKMGLLLAVGRCAVHGPNLIIMEYRGDPHSKDFTALVGKGITYDTGGLNIKPTGSMETMKCDMAGGGAVIGTMRTLAALKVKRNVVGVIAAAENAIGPESYKPGDVFRGLSGKSVEITNTDAEGRLVLADALTYVQREYALSQIIDLGTLTGGVVIALGEDVAGLFANNEILAKKLFEAGEATGERVWRLPVYPAYRDLLKSSIADIKNSGPRKATPIQGAVFLQEFIDNVPWAHLDIAGTAFHAESFATGFGVRLLVHALTAV